MNVLKISGTPRSMSSARALSQVEVAGLGPDESDRSVMAKKNDQDFLKGGLSELCCRFVPFLVFPSILFLLNYFPLLKAYGSRM